MGLAPHYAEGVVGLAADSGGNYVRLAAVHQGEWKKFYLGWDRKLDQEVNSVVENGYYYFHGDVLRPSVCYLSL